MNYGIIKKILSSKILRVFLFIIGFFFIWKLVWDKNYLNEFESVFYNICFFSIMFITCISVWLDRKNGFILSRMSKIDYSLLLTITVIVFVTGANLLRGVFNIDYSPYETAPFETVSVLIPRMNVFFISLFAYICSYMLMVVTVRHIRNKNFIERLYLLQFFKAYPPNTAAGFCVLIIIVCVIAFLFFILFNSCELIIITLNIVCLSAMIYLCSYLTKLSKVYEKANEDKIRAERFKTELITNVSHDIRTPLTSIINYVDLVKRLEIKDDKLTEYTAVLDKKSARLKVLINDLMEASKAGTGNIKVNLESINLAEIVGQIAGEFDTSFADNSLTYVMNPLPSEVIVLADGSHLWRVMENIFGNAVKYSMPDTRVYAGIKTDDDNATFTLKNVSRQPLNISADELMERFVRGDRSRHTDGNGLGLYIARNLTELMGGEFVIVINGDLFEVALKLKKTAHSLE